MAVVDKEGNDIIKGSPRIDGWQNLFSGVGKRGRDKTDANYYTPYPYIYFDDELLTHLYTYEGLATKIIDTPANDMTRSWVTIENDDEGKIQEELKRIDAHNKINMAIKFTRLYRGALIFMVFEGDTTDFSTPAPKTIKGIKALRIYSAARVRITQANIISDVDSNYFDEVEIFPIRTRGGQLLNVHESRCLVFKGDPSPDFDINIDFEYRYWGLPVMVRIFERLSNYGIIEKGVSTLMQEASVGKYSIANLANFLAQNTNETINKIYTRIDIIDRSKSVLNAVLLDANSGEDYSRDTLNLSGIEGIIDRGMMNLSSVCGIPVTLLFGRSPAGQNATGDSDFENYYKSVRSEQTNWLIYPLRKLVNIVAGYLKVSEPKVRFNPLREADEKEKAEIRKLNSESDKIDIEQGIHTPEEILERRESENPI